MDLRVDRSPLLVAIEQGAPPAVIQGMVRDDPHLLQERDENNWLPLFYAIDRGAPAPVIECLADGYPDALHDMVAITVAFRARHWAPLHLAAYKDAPVDVVQLLVNKGHEALEQEECDGGRQPLHVAARYASLPVVQCIANASPKALLEPKKCKEVGLPLHEAVIHGNWRVVRWLVERSPEALKVKCLYEARLPLHCAAAHNQASVDIVDCLLKGYRVALMVKDFSGQLPLHLSVGSGQELVRFLADEGPTAIQEKDSQGCLPLHCAARRASVEVFQLLENEFPEAMFAKDSNGRLPLHHATDSWRAKVDKVEWMADKLPEALAVADNDGKLPLHLAAAIHGPAVLDSLTDRFPDALTTRDTKGRLPAHMAASENRLFDAVVLLAFVSPRDATDDDGWLLLHHAVQKGKIDIVEHFVRSRPQDLMVPDKNGLLPLHLAAQKGRRDVVACLITSGPRALMVPDKNGLLPMHHAAKEGGVEVVQCLGESSQATLMVPDNIGRLPLHHAVCPGALDEPDQSGLLQFRWFSPEVKPELVEYLVERCPESVKVSDKYGRLPLHCAAQKGNYEVVQCLMGVHMKALGKRTQSGWLAVHVSAVGNAPLDSIYSMARAHPQSLTPMISVHVEIRALRVEINALKDQIKSHCDEIKVRDDQITDFVAQLKARDDQIKAKDDQIKARDEQISALQRALNDLQNHNAEAIPQAQPSSLAAELAPPEALQVDRGLRRSNRQRKPSQRLRDLVCPFH